MKDRNYDFIINSLLLLFFWFQRIMWQLLLIAYLVTYEINLFFRIILDRMHKAYEISSNIS